VKALDKLTHRIRRRRVAGVIIHAFVTLAFIGIVKTNVGAQVASTTVSVLSLSPPRIRIEGKRLVATRVWSFRNVYGSLLGIGERIENLKLKDLDGADIPVRKLASGEYEAARDAIGWSCEIKLDPPPRSADAAHASWLTGDRGFIMLGDVLPYDSDAKTLPAGTSMVRLVLPTNWNVYSSESLQADGQFAVHNTEDAIFFIGSNLRQKRERVGQIDVAMVTEGKWAFSDQEVMRIVSRVLKEYQSRVGIAPGPRAAVFLSHFPTAVSAERWSAETRGNTITLLSGESPSVVAGLAQLSTPLTHELFHLWVPNGIRLTGNYDWFYEGFTIYEALCVAQRLGFLTFDDVLNAIGRSYDAYTFSSEGRTLSLIEASKRRWTGPTALIYQKGLLVAFLYDLSLRQMTRGKRTMDDVYRSLFRDRLESAEPRDGNEVVLRVLRGQGDLGQFIQNYIENASEIDLKSMVAPFGLAVEQVNRRTRISAAEKINSQQRDLLRSLGYNNETRRGGRK
jgi:hypothetical protein